VDKGNTVIVIEHNLDVIKSADWVIDLGPDGGNRGGQIVAVGTPEEVAANPDSHTGAFLARVLTRAGHVPTIGAPTPAPAPRAPLTRAKRPSKRAAGGGRAKAKQA
ncbi:MAG: excinuclease ABC subunit A, partial [Micrococcales bacterium]|nr:excinuclease ABC subunit A [Micrococcales bacterium]